MVKKKARKIKRKVSIEGGASLAKRRILFVIKDLFFFILLFVFSLLLYRALTGEMLIFLFGLLSIIFGALAVAFLITLLVMLFTQYFRKK